MTTTSSAPKHFTAGIVLACASLMFAVMAFLAYLWWSASPVLGRLYAGIRVAESAGLWLFTSWGKYFTAAPVGASYHFTSIFKSSVPFGIAATLVTAAIGFLAYRKRASRHLDVVLATPKGGFTSEAILRDMKPVLPHAVLPPLPSATEGSAGVAARPSANPFASLRDLRDTRSVSEAITHLSWHEAATFALLLDAITPIPDRTRPEALLKSAWKTIRPDKSGKRPVPNESAIAAIQATLAQAISDLGGRDLALLEQAHDALTIASTTHEVASALSYLAQSNRTLFLPDYAWLGTLDPLLHRQIYMPIEARAA